MFPGPPNPEDASAAAHPRLQEIPSTEEELQAGWIFAVDKPLEWTSFDVVNKLKYALRRAYGLKSVKIGHAGTLDPLATGVLVVCVGKATKRIESEMAGSKGYRARLKLGFTTPSYDAETPEEAFSGAVFPSSTAALEAVLPNFRGTIHQRPPLYSALKIGGQTLYKLARRWKSPPARWWWSLWKLTPLIQRWEALSSPLYAAKARTFVPWRTTWVMIGGAGPTSPHCGAPT